MCACVHLRAHSTTVTLVPLPGLAALPGWVSLDHTGHWDSPDWSGKSVP